MRSEYGLIHSLKGYTIEIYSVCVYTVRDRQRIASAGRDTTVKNGMRRMAHSSVLSIVRGQGHFWPTR